jgi:hypothetical protein
LTVLIILPALLVLFSLGFAVSGRYGNRLVLSTQLSGLDEKSMRRRRTLLWVSTWACYLAAAAYALLALVTATAIAQYAYYYHHR